MAGRPCRFDVTGRCESVRGERAPRQEVQTGVALNDRLYHRIQTVSIRTTERRDSGTSGNDGVSTTGNHRLFWTTRLLRGPEPLQLRIELHPGDPERGRRGRLVALGLRERIRDRVSLELLKGRLRGMMTRDA